MSAARRKRLIRRSISVLGACALLWVSGCAVLYFEMRKPPEEFARFMTRVPAPAAFMLFPFETLWTHARAGDLRIGDAAPDFTLSTVDKSEMVQLSTLNRQQPVVLIFGSYT